jgi:hypothetical protein
MLTIEYRSRYWTVCIDGRAAFTFPSLAAAQESVPEAEVVL